MPFRFRLAKVLEWYERQYQIETSRLRHLAERATSAHLELAQHRESRIANENQILTLEALDGNDLRAKQSYREQSMLEESRLIRFCQDADKDVEIQRSATMSAQRKVRLVEKLRERKREEFNYLAGRDLEEIAADSWLAGFARNLSENNHSER
jgi:hypothetical protein